MGGQREHYRNLGQVKTLIFVWDLQNQSKNKNRQKMFKSSNTEI